MTKTLLNLTKRQYAVIKMLSKQEGLSLSEVVRRAIDSYINKLVKKGELVRFDFTASNRTEAVELTKEMYDNMVKYVDEHPDGAVQRSKD